MSADYVVKRKTATVYGKPDPLQLIDPLSGLEIYDGHATFTLEALAMANRIEHISTFSLNEVKEQL